jgi:hypothetical protein
MPTTYATAFAAHHARGSTLRPPDTTFRPRDTMVHRPTMLRARDTMVHRPTMLRARDTTTTTRSTQSLGDFSASVTIRVPETPPFAHRAGFSFLANDAPFGTPLGGGIIDLFRVMLA